MRVAENLDGLFDQADIDLAQTLLRTADYEQFFRWCRYMLIDAMGEAEWERARHCYTIAHARMSPEEAYESFYSWFQDEDFADDVWDELERQSEQLISRSEDPIELVRACNRVLPKAHRLHEWVAVDKPVQAVLFSRVRLT